MKTPNIEAIKNATDAEKNEIMGLAIGRLLHLGSRPPQSGDEAEFENIKAIVLAARVAA
jgi:hypothetical protein